MTGKQHAVLWLGLLLIAIRLFTTNQWRIIWTDLTTGSTSSGNSGGSGGKKGIGKPPFIPLPGGGILPLSAHQSNGGVTAV